MSDNLKARLWSWAEEVTREFGGTPEQTDQGQAKLALDARDAEIARLREALEDCLWHIGKDRHMDAVPERARYRTAQVEAADKARTALNGGDDEG